MNMLPHPCFRLFFSKQSRNSKLRNIIQKITPVGNYLWMFLIYLTSKLSWTVSFIKYEQRRCVETVICLYSKEVADKQQSLEYSFNDENIALDRTG